MLAVRMKQAAAGASSFSPSDISGLQLWLDANDLTTLWQDSGASTPVASDGDPVGAWTDKSTNGYLPIQATTGNKPTYKTGIQNGLPVLRFDGGDFLEATFNAFFQPGTLFVVYQSTNDEEVGCLYDGYLASSPANDIQIFSDTRTATKRHANWRAGAADKFIDQATKCSAATFYISVTQAEIPGDSASGWRDGIPQANIVTSISPGTGEDTTRIGQRQSSGLSHTGDIGQILAYDSALSITDINSVGNYLADKWGGTWNDIVFAPSDISGLISWHDASDISTLWQDSARSTAVASDGDPVGAWDDKSGGGNHVLQATTAKKPAYKTGIQNGLPVLRFDGDDALVLGGLGRVQPLTYFIIVSFNTQPKWALDGTGGSGANVAIASTGTTQVRLVTGTAIITDLISYDVLHLIAATADGVNSFISVDGNAAATGTSGVNNPDGITIGAAGNGLGNVAGDITEVIVYDSALSAGNVASVKDYLNNKWAVH